MNEIQLIGDEELLNALRQLDYSTQHRILKRVLNDSANKLIVTPLKAASPVSSGTLRASMGTKVGRSRVNAVVFAGPRMGGRRGGVEHKGYIANIIEFNKGGIRYPGVDKKSGGLRKRPMTPHGTRKHSGKMPTTHKGYISRTIEQAIPGVQKSIAGSVRVVIERAWNRAVKRGLI